MHDTAIHRLTLGCLLAGFVGPEMPGWLAQALQDGLGGVVLFGSNIGDPHRHPWQRRVLDTAMRHPDCVIVDAGWPAEGLPEPYLRSRGVTPGLFAAVADALAGTQA